VRLIRKPQSIHHPNRRRHWRSGLHGKNYLLASESYALSDMSRMLNQQSPLNGRMVVYDSALARNALGVPFRPAQEILFSCV
jgi:hypothetical protein